MNTLTRWMRHLWLDEANVRHLITREGLARLEARVQASESRHRGELRLCIEGGLPAQALWSGTTSRERAIELFSELRVWDTEHNNGVLIYLQLADHRIEVLADRGLMQQVPDAVWQDMTNALGQHLQAGHFEAGLTQAIDQVGALLHVRYPLVAGQTNIDELPNAVVLL